MQLTLRGSGDGKRYLHILGVGGGRSGVGRHLLIVDIDRTLDVPIVGWRLLVVVVDTVVGIAVVDNTFRAVDEVARGLQRGYQGRCIAIALVSASLIAACGCILLVISRQNDVGLGGIIAGCAMLVLGIDIATTLDVLFHIDEGQLHDTGDVTIVFLLGCTLLGGQLQEHTGGQGHLILADTLVALAAGQVFGFEVIEALIVISKGNGFCLRLLIVDVYLSLVSKVHVTGEVAQIVHHTVNAEVVAVDSLVGVGIVF